MSWQNICDRRRKRTLRQAPGSWILPKEELDSLSCRKNLVDLPGKYLSENEYCIVSLKAYELFGKLSNGEISAVEVTEAFCHAATIAHQLANCLSDLLYHEAMMAARKLDEYYMRNGKPIGPLHGLPISIKDNIHVQGTDSSLGIVSLVDKIDLEDSSIVAQIRQMGGIPFCKTIASAATMSCDCESNVFGRTINPGNTNLIPGSSSGGEATLISLHGSCLGIGTDLGGSIRFPTSFQGLYGLKPSSGKLSLKGCTDLVNSIPTVVSTVGPMARDPLDLEIFMKALAICPSLKFPDSTWLGPKRIALLRNNNVVPISSAIQAAITTVQLVFEANSWTIINWDPEQLHKNASDLIGKAFATHGYTNIMNAINASEEPPPPRLRQFLTSPRSDNLTSLYNDLDYVRNELKKKFNEYNVEFLISPVATETGYVFGDPGASDGSYTCIWNLCDFPTVTFPVHLKSQVVGLQIIGTREKEAQLLSLVKLLQTI